MARCHYRVGPHDVLDLEYTLVDQDANGGICGCNMKVLEGSERFVDVVGLPEHKFKQPRIITAQALVASHKGVTRLPHFTKWHCFATSILPCLQMKAFGADINDCSCLLPSG
jgi:hypothetical protein